MNSKTALILGLVIAAIAKVDGSRGGSISTTAIPNTLVVTLVMTVVGVLGRQQRYPVVKPQTIVVKPQRPKYGRPQASYGRPVGGRPGAKIYQHFTAHLAWQSRSWWRWRRRR